MARVDLIVPTFNGTSFLIACLDSLSSSTYSDFNLIIVDDGSDEPVESAVHMIYPEARIIRFERNIGLTRAFNAAIDASNSEYIVLLNNDTEVEPDWLRELVSCADRHPKAASIASKLRLASDRGKLHSAGDTYSVRGMPGNRGVWLDDFAQYDSEDEIFSVCAGAALYRRQALELVRLANGDTFDTRLFMYCEDVDLGWRLQCSGFSCVFAPQAVVYHHLSATGGGELASYYVSRNVWFVLARSVPAAVQGRYRMRIACYHLGRLLRTICSVQQTAARRSLVGTLHGFALYVKSRERAPRLNNLECERIIDLLADR